MDEPEIDEVLLTHLESLARLDLAPEERTEVLEDLRRVLAFVADLAADAPNGEPEAPGPARLREDVPAPGLDPESALDLAPRRSGRFFEVPRTVEEG